MRSQYPKSQPSRATPGVLSPSPSKNGLKRLEELWRRKRLAGGLAISILTILTGSAFASEPVNSPPLVREGSPDGSVQCQVAMSEQGRLVYQIQARGQVILKDSPLGIEVEGDDLGAGSKLAGKPTSRKIHQTYETIGAHTLAQNRYREVVVPLQKGERKFSLVIRVFDDGVGLRYEFAEAPQKFTGESTGWVFPENCSYAWSRYNQSYEDLYQYTPAKDIPVEKALGMPVTVKVGAWYASITEADCCDFPDLALKWSGTGFAAHYPFPDQGGWVSDKSPWRVTIVASDLTELANTDVVKSLCPAPEPVMDFTWVKPGRCLWQWLSVGAPKFEDQQSWFNAAAELGWEYYLIDDGWRDWSQPGMDCWECLRSVIAYGKSKGVRTLVWGNFKEMRSPEERRAYLEKIHSVGASGIKIDFLPPATAEMMKWYQGALRDTADLKLLCNFHGCVKPTGQERTWPQNLTREAIRGHEYQISRYHRTMPPEMDSILPFTRLVAGPADYTPTVFNPQELRGYTWAHELAQALVYLSPLTHFADHYWFYLNNPATDLLKEIPTTWDQTLVLPPSTIGGAVGFARRKGDTWWIGIVNSGQPAKWNLPLTFLRGPAKATLLADNADRDDAFDRKETVLGPKDVLPIALHPSGGFVAVFKPGR